MNVRTLCLAILHFGEVTGYEIKKLAEDGKFCYFIEASFGAIYPALTRMSSEGLVTWRTESQEGKPSRKIYSITDQGRATFIESLYEEPKPDRFKSEFLLTMLCSDLLDCDYVTKLIDKRIGEVKKEIEMFNNLKDAGLAKSEEFVFSYGNHMNKASLEFLLNQRQIIENQNFTKP